MRSAGPTSRSSWARSPCPPPGPRGLHCRVAEDPRCPRACPGAVGPPVSRWGKPSCPAIRRARVPLPDAAGPSMARTKPLGVRLPDPAMCPGERTEHYCATVALALVDPFRAIAVSPHAIRILLVRRVRFPRPAPRLRPLTSGPLVPILAGVVDGHRLLGCQPRPRLLALRWSAGWRSVPPPVPLILARGGRPPSATDSPSRASPRWPHVPARRRASRSLSLPRPSSRPSITVVPSAEAAALAARVFGPS